MALAADGILLFSAIVPKAEEQTLRLALVGMEWTLLGRWRREGSLENLRGRKLKKISIGDGTSSREIVGLLGDGVKYELVDEKNSTLEGRRRYWRLHPPRGLWRLLPTSLRVPPRDIDDLAAWALVEQA